MTTKTIRINRRNWIRGRWADSLLWDPLAKQGCCLGHAMKQVCKIDWEPLEHIGMPHEVSDEIKARFYAAVKSANGSTMTRIATINDAQDMSNEVREEKLKKLFKDKLGLKLEFYN